MRTIKQIDRIGCGIACVAMLGDVTYDEAKKEIFGERPIRLTSSGPLFKALRKFRRKPLVDRMVPLKMINLDHLTYDCLVGATLDGDKHWVVWDARARKIRDPWHFEDYDLRIKKYAPIA